jgi:XTP/dITP diphosphohydrolase
LTAEVNSGAIHEKIEDEFGDVLFSLINYARFLKINPENALSKTNNKFRQRFMLMENLMKLDSLSIDDSDLEIMDTYWEKAKIQLRAEHKL